jgi:hypothetical protein
MWVGPCRGMQLAATNQSYEHSATQGQIHDVCPGEDPDALVHFTPRGRGQSFDHVWEASAGGQNQLNLWISRHNVVSIHE